MSKLISMERKRFTSPVAMLDAVAKNIATIAKALGVEFSSGVSVVRFSPAFGETVLSYTVTVDGVVYSSDVNGSVDVLVELNSEVEYTVSADGYLPVHGTLFCGHSNESVMLPRFVSGVMRHSVAVEVFPPEASAVAEVSINGEAGSAAEFVEGTPVVVEVSAEGYKSALENISSLRASTVVRVTLEPEVEED